MSGVVDQNRVFSHPNYILFAFDLVEHCLEEGLLSAEEVIHLLKNDLLDRATELGNNQYSGQLFDVISSKYSGRTFPKVIEDMFELRSDPQSPLGSSSTQVPVSFSRAAKQQLINFGLDSDLVADVILERMSENSVPSNYSTRIDFDKHFVLRVSSNSQIGDDSQTYLLEDVESKIPLDC